MKWPLWWGLGWTIGFCLVSCFLEAAPTARQQAAVRTLSRKATAAEQLYRDGKINESADAIRSLVADYQTLVQEAAKEPELTRLLEPVRGQLERLYAFMELEGVSLPELPKLPDPKGATTGTTSFTRQVAPILVAQCGRCHIERQSGMFSMATYAALMRGSDAGRVIVPKDGKGSRLIELIEAGDMPRGGGRVSPEELSLLKNWIDEGATYDGQDPNQPLVTFVPREQNTQQMPMLTVVPATGKETVKFALQLAPILVEQCLGCHGEGNGQPGGGLNMATFANFVRGGQSGPPWVPGKPDESLLVRKLRGTAGERMPRGRPPLPDETITQFAKWIEEGAPFDGLAADSATRRVAAVAKALAATHEELAAQRLERARQYWQLAFPSIQPDVVTTEYFTVLGNLGPKTLEELAQQAEKTAGRVATLLKVPGGQLKVKGKIVLFALNSRYHYSEFGRMVEERQVPSHWRGHWKFDTVDAYGVLTVTRSNEYDNQALLGQVAAGAYVASLGDVPRWFAEGMARAAAARLAPRDPRVLAWDAQTSGILATLAQPDGFLTGTLSAEDADLCAYRFVNFLLARDARRATYLLRSLAEGAKFDEAFSRIYGATPNQMAVLWYQGELRGGR